MAQSPPKVGLDRSKVGRKKGTPNKTTKLLKDAILKAAEKAGGKGGLVSYLQRQASENPGAFLALLGKVLPMQIAGTLTISHEDALNELDGPGTDDQA